jgi:hypothetical protein
MFSLLMTPLLMILLPSVGGSSIRQLQQHSGAHVQISKETNSEGKIVVEITGTADQTSECNKLIRELILATNPGLSSKAVRAPPVAKSKAVVEPLPAPDW